MIARFSAAILFAGTVVSVCSQVVVPTHLRISPAYVAEAVVRGLSESGIQITSRQVLLPAKLVATESSPILDIISVEPLKDQYPDYSAGVTAKVRVACHIPVICIPFYAIVTLPADTFDKARFRSNKNGDTETPATKAKPSAIRFGNRAILLLNDGRAQIEISVVSLENGDVGQLIRVASPDHRHVYVAEVISASVLKGRF
jgi:hypothetical protein